MLQCCNGQIINITSRATDMLIIFRELCIIIHWIYSLYENLDFMEFWLLIVFVHLLFVFWDENSPGSWIWPWLLTLLLGTQSHATITRLILPLKTLRDRRFMWCACKDLKKTFSPFTHLNYANTPQSVLWPFYPFFFTDGKLWHRKVCFFLKSCVGQSGNRDLLQIFCLHTSG